MGGSSQPVVMVHHGEWSAVKMSLGLLVLLAYAPIQASVALTTNVTADEMYTINVVLLVPLTGIVVGQSFHVGAVLAAEHVNRHPDVLPGYRLNLNVVNTKVGEKANLDCC